MGHKSIFNFKMAQNSVFFLTVKYKLNTTSPLGPATVLGRDVCDLDFVPCTVSIVTYISYELLSPETSRFVFKLLKL